MDIKILLGILLVILISGCASPQEQFQQQVDQALSEEFEYTEFYNDGFSILYPVWPATTGDFELGVTKGYCSVVINSEKMTADQWYDLFMDAIDEQELEVIISDEGDKHIKYSSEYQNITMINDNMIFDCRDGAVAVSIVCMEDVEEKVQAMHTKIFDSASCEEDSPKQVQKVEIDAELKYKDFDDDDFSVEYPEWDVMPTEDESLLAVSKGVCSVLVNKHNALPGDISDWLQTAIKDNDDHELMDASEDDDVYHLSYEMPYEETTVTSTMKVFYCNYQSYITQILCVNELVTEEYEDIRDKILDSAECSKRYEIPTPELIEEKKEEIIEEEPDVIEEIEDEIVKTNAGEEFGIDEEMVVYFINNNVFFGKIMKDFPKGNLVIEDDDRELKLRVKIDDDGKITSLEDGEYSDADVTLIIPLRDALNIFSNAQNINPLTLLGFAVNVRTDPPELKNEIIQKVLRGEYN